MLIDVLTSAAAAGAQRIFRVNAHGGNSVVCQAAAAAAASNNDLVVAHIDYWNTPPEGAEIPGARFLGQAGEFEAGIVWRTILISYGSGSIARNLRSMLFSAASRCRAVKGGRR